MSILRRLIRALTGTRRQSPNAELYARPLADILADIERDRARARRRSATPRQEVKR